MSTSRQLKNNHWIRRIDWVLIGILVLLAFVSVTIINSAMGGGQYSANFSIRQILYYVWAVPLHYSLCWFHLKSS